MTATRRLHPFSLTTGSNRLTRPPCPYVTPLTRPVILAANRAMGLNSVLGRLVHVLETRLTAAVFLLADILARNRGAKV